MKWAEPSFAISSIDMTELRERLLTKIDTAQSVKAQKDDEYKILNRAFLESKSLPKINVKSLPKFLCIWQVESPNFTNEVNLG